MAAPLAAEEAEELAIVWGATFTALRDLLEVHSKVVVTGELEAASALAEDQEASLDDMLGRQQASLSRQGYLDSLAQMTDLKARVLLLRKRLDVAKRDPLALQGAGAGAVVVAGPAAKRTTARLPKFELVKFDGNPVSFQSFIDVFDSSIDQCLDLTAVEKLQYLRSSCVADAEVLIRSFPLTAQAYPLAMAALRQTFGSELAQKCALIRTIKDVKPVLDMTPIKSVKALHTTISSSVRLLDQLQVPVRTAGLFLIPDILVKFPSRLTYRFYQKYDKGQDNAIELLDFLAKEIEQAEFAELTNPKSKPVVKDGRPPRETGAIPKSTLASCNVVQNSRSGAKAQFKGQPTSSRPGKTECVFCGADHFNANCDTIVSAPERYEVVKQKRLCFNCLRGGHTVPQCKIRFCCRHCGARHHSALCSKKDSSESRKESSKKEDPPSVTLTVASNIQLMMFTALLVHGDGESTVVRGIIDPGSHRSFVTKRLVTRLGLKAQGMVATMTQRLDDPCPVPISSRVFRVILKSRHTEKRVAALMFEAGSLPTVQGNVGTRVASRLNQLNLPLAEVFPPASSEVDILLGGEVWWGISMSGRRRLSKHLGLSKTVFGWVLNGVTGSTDPFEEERVVSALNVSCMVAEDPVQRLWTLDALGICPGEKDSDFVRDRFDKSAVRLPNGRYQVDLPFNDKIGSLDPNWAAALSQLSATLRRVDSSKDLAGRYDRAMHEYLDEGHAEIVPNGHEDGGRTYYIPHHPVIKEDRQTTKFRVVFNASSARKGHKSLNDCLYPGPSLNPDILSVLIRFRLLRCLVISDIKKAFLQVAINPDHRDVLRFLWVHPKYFESSYSWANLWEHLMVCRMTVVPFGVNSSPFLLNASIRKQGMLRKLDFPREAEALDGGIYVDDLTSGSDTEDDAFVHAQNLRDILAEAQMPLVKWVGSSEKLHDMLKRENFHMREEVYSEIKSIKLLGTTWNLDEDTISYRIHPASVVVTTKRELLSEAAAVFDPLGLISPVMLEIKLMIQRLWALPIGWEEVLPLDEQARFLAWLSDLQRVREFVIPRWMGTGMTSPFMLDIYCDASTVAYGCAVYLQTTSGHRRLLMAKSRVAPVRGVTLPRLELTAATVGARILTYIRDHLPMGFTIGRARLYSDSMVTLGWLRSTKNQWKAYVSNRVAEILTHTSIDQWHYVPTACNPADVLTRPISAEVLQNHPLWWSGPSLEGSAEEAECQFPDEERMVVGVALVGSQDVAHLSACVRRVSSWIRLKRVFAYVLRWATCDVARDSVLSIEEMDRAKRKLVWISQQEYFPEEISCLKNKLRVKSTSQLHMYHVFLDPDGLIRLRTRLERAQLDFLVSHPLMLHPDSWVTRLIIRFVHERLLHGDTSETLYRVRDECWVLRGRRTVKSVIRNCPVCRRLTLPRNDPLVGELPSERVTPSAPFANAGIDFMGPLYVGESTRQTRKCYVLLFTCMVTRAVHLEVTVDLTVASFLLAFRRFAARYGYPAKVFSDNARTFQRGRLELRSWGSLLGHEGIRTFFTNQHVDWVFSPPLSPWWGGVWERMVRSVKDKLRRLFGRRLVNLETLQTSVLEIAAVLNSRPLTYVHEDPHGGFILTPNHFLTAGRPKVLLNRPLVAIRASDLRRLEQKRRLVIMEFWSMWTDSYLKQLRNFHQSAGGSRESDLKQDQIVLVERAGKNLFFWPLARVVELLPGEDGIVRVVRIVDSDGKTSLRSVKHVRALEGGPN